MHGVQLPERPSLGRLTSFDLGLPLHDFTITTGVVGDQQLGSCLGLGRKGRPPSRNRELPIICTMLEPEASNPDVTRILKNWTSLENPAEELFPVVYAQLRSLADGMMRSERDDHTLGTTALVHEAFLKLMSTTERSGAMESAQNRGYFFAAAAQAMRRVLVDHARVRAAERRGGGQTPIDLGQLPADIGELAQHESPDLVIAIDHALTVLEREDEAASEVVRLRFFGNLTAKEVAQLLGVAERTVMRRWSFARARLFQILEGQA